MFYHLKPDLSDINDNFRMGSDTHHSNTLNPFGFDRIFYATEHQLEKFLHDKSNNRLEINFYQNDWRFEKGENECCYIPSDEIKVRLNVHWSI